MSGIIGADTSSNQDELTLTEVVFEQIVSSQKAPKRERTSSEEEEIAFKNKNEEEEALNNARVNAQKAVPDNKKKADRNIDNIVGNNENKSTKNSRQTIEKNDGSGEEISTSTSFLKPIDKIMEFAGTHNNDVDFNKKTQVLTDKKSGEIICRVPKNSGIFRGVKTFPPKTSNKLVFPNKKLSSTGAELVQSLLEKGTYELSCNKLETALNFMKSAAKESGDFGKHIDNLSFPNKKPFNTEAAKAEIAKVMKEIKDQASPKASAKLNS